MAILMDPIEKIDRHHDTSFLFLLKAQQRGWQLFYFQQQQLYIKDGKVKTTAQPIKVFDNEEFFELGELQACDLSEFDVVLMRKDPPFNMQYIYTTYLLELAEAQGCWVVNNPKSLRDANEKMFTLWFPELCPATIVTSEKPIIKQFWQEQGDIILKPIDGMGGQGIFFAGKNDINVNSMIEMLTNGGAMPIMAQCYLPAIRTHGDRRIILINGEPVPYALVRMPAADDIRGNMVAKATIKVEPLTAQQYQLCEVLAPTLQAKGLSFVGLDVIGDKVTEINVTSPTGSHEIANASKVDVGALFIDFLARKLQD